MQNREIVLVPRFQKIRFRSSGALEKWVYGSAFSSFPTHAATWRGCAKNKTQMCGELGSEVDGEMRAGWSYTKQQTDSAHENDEPEDVLWPECGKSGSQSPIFISDDASHVLNVAPTSNIKSIGLPNLKDTDVVLQDCKVNFKAFGSGVRVTPALGSEGTSEDCFHKYNIITKGTATNGQSTAGTTYVLQYWQIKTPAEHIVYPSDHAGRISNGHACEGCIAAFEVQHVYAPIFKKGHFKDAKRVTISVLVDIGDAGESSHLVTPEFMNNFKDYTEPACTEQGSQQATCTNPLMFTQNIVSTKDADFAPFLHHAIEPVGDGPRGKFKPHYTYQGSQSVPPCLSNMTWIITKERATMNHGAARVFLSKMALTKKKEYSQASDCSQYGTALNFTQNAGKVPAQVWGNYDNNNLKLYPTLPYLTYQGALPYLTLPTKVTGPNIVF